VKSVKLYGYTTSPFVRKTGCFLYYKGVKFEHVPVNPANPAETIRFSGGTQVPVLEIDGEWKTESSHHAHWLDDVFPEKPLCPPDHKEKIAKIDDWISNTFLVSIFRHAVDGEVNLAFRYRAWRLAALVSAQTPLPEQLRNSWPDVLKQASFIKAMAEHMDLNESPQAMNARIGAELVAHIDDGPFIGGLHEPTMLDLAVFPQLVFGYMFGLEERLSAAAHPDIKSWLSRVAKHLPENPTLAADFMQVRKLADGLS